MPLLVVLLLIITPAIADVCIQPDYAIKSLDNNTNDIEITAKNSQVIDGLFILDEDVEIQNKYYYISADKVTANPQQGTFFAKGNVKAQAPKMIFSAKQMRSDNNSLLAEDVAYNILPNNTKGRAKKIVVNNNQKATLTDTSYSSCDGPNLAWELKSDEIILDRDNNTGVAKDVVFKFFGLPVLWLPRYDFVLFGRKTGVLLPKFSKYSVGLEEGHIVEIPYYINLAPDRDATIGIVNNSNRGTILSTEYRQLFANNEDDGYLQINGEYLSQDKIAKESRWLIDSSYKAKIDNVGIKINYNKVSDINYLSQIKHDQKVDRLESNIELQYNKDNLYLSAFSEKHQIITGDNIYIRDLVLKLAKSINYKGIDYKVDASHAVFNHKDIGKPTGNRNYMGVNLSKTFNQNFYQITPSVKLSETRYKLNQDHNKSISRANINVDAKMFFERRVNFFARDLTQNFTPRISYFYSTKKDQQGLPNFDSARRALDYDTIFNGNNWTGLDRVDSANNIAIGFNSNFIDNNSGQNYFDFSMGQNFNIDNHTKSNLFAENDININRFNIYNSIEFDNKIVARKSFIGYKNNDNFVNIGYHQEKDDKYLSANFSIALTGRSHVFAGTKRALTEKITNKNTVGFLYNSCCYALRVAHFDSYNDTIQGHDKTTSIELIFKELASTDNALYNRIKEEIPRYINDIN